MLAAVVSSFDHPPRSTSVPEPAAAGPHQVVLDVLAAALHPRVRSQADGSHYTSEGALPLIPGIDGVGRDPEGVLRYFVLPDTSEGSMAQRVVVDLRRSVVLPDGADPVLLAAGMNPAMSSWVALRRRIALPPAARVLVMGATGSAGRVAVQVARRLGASSVVGAGRDPRRLAALPELGADAVIDLAGDPAAALAEAGRDLDVVLDYLWGEPAAAALRAIVPARADDDRPLSWIQIGAVAGAEAPVPSAALRATDLRLLGSGQGSVPTRAIVEELTALATALGEGAFDVAARAMPLDRVEEAWADRTTEERIVLVP